MCTRPGIIKRYFSDENFLKLKQDFQFLVKLIKSYLGELELSFREDSFNLYFRGNSAAKVKFNANKKYTVYIHKKFFPDSLQKDHRFSYQKSRNYYVIRVTADMLHTLLQKKYLNEIYSNIKKENYSEELSFEQMLIADNINREDFIIIDRQVSDPVLERKRMDLLALQQVELNKYAFSVLEVKMGNNPELKDSVADQIGQYIKHIGKFFKDYKFCYEKQYQQKKEFGIIEKPDRESIEIVSDVKGMIIVGGYSGIAHEQIKKLKSNNPNLTIKNFPFIL